MISRLPYTKVRGLNSCSRPFEHPATLIHSTQMWRKFRSSTFAPKSRKAFQSSHIFFPRTILQIEWHYLFGLPKSVRQLRVQNIKDFLFLKNLFQLFFFLVVERGRVGWYDVKTAIVYRRFRVPLGNYSWTSSKAKYLWKWSNLETNSFDCKMKSRGQRTCLEPSRDKQSQPWISGLLIINSELLLLLHSAFWPPNRRQTRWNKTDRRNRIF